MMSSRICYADRSDARLGSGCNFHSECQQPRLFPLDRPNCHTIPLNSNGATGRKAAPIDQHPVDFARRQTGWLDMRDEGRGLGDVAESYFIASVVEPFCFAHWAFADKRVVALSFPRG